MRHRHAGKLLSRSYEHRKALYRNLIIELLEHKSIRTTLAKAKAVQPEVEKLITLARQDTPHNRRMVLSKLDSKVAMRLAFSTIPQRYAEQNHGFTRITKLGPRHGDGAEMAVIELV
jgi:large subunit ribosomal protein L17